MMSIVSNTRVDIVARGVIKACLELGYDPAEKIAIFRIPGAWEEEGFKILEKYGVEYCDRSVSMHEAARRAVEKIQGAGGLMSILIDENTTFIVQGITGREAVNLTRECLDYGKGAKVVGGVTPGPQGPRRPRRAGVRHRRAGGGAPRRADQGLGRDRPPRLHQGRRVRGDRERHRADRDRHRAHPARRRGPDGRAGRRTRGARIIGPNCLGVIVPDVIKMGGIGGPARDAAKAYSPGPVGVISRSGGMTTEMSSTLTAAGLGQSTAVSIGGDAIIGSSYAELMPLFEADEQTEAIVIYTEPGGRMEAELARYVTEEPPGSCRSWRSWPAASWTRCRA